MRVLTPEKITLLIGLIGSVLLRISGPISLAKNLVHFYLATLVHFWLAKYNRVGQTEKEPAGTAPMGIFQNHGLASYSGSHEPGQYS